MDKEKEKTKKQINKKNTKKRKPNSFVLELNSSEHKDRENIGENIGSYHKGYILHKKITSFIIIGLLIINILIGISILHKINLSWNRTILGNGGIENMNNLKKVYESDEYKNYFGIEIMKLENNIGNINQ